MISNHCNILRKRNGEGVQYISTMLPDIDPNIWASHTFHSSASQLGQIHLGHPTPLDTQHKQDSLRLYVKLKTDYTYI